MNILDILPLIQVFAGACIIVIAITIALKIRKDVSTDLHRKWLVTIALMGFFIVGYFLFIGASAFGVKLPLDQIVGMIFLAGAVFVYIIIKLSETSIRLISEQDRDLQAYALVLKKKTDALETSIEEKTRAEFKARKRSKDLSALHTIDMSISSSLSLEVTMRVLLDQAIHRLHIDAACILLLDSHTQVLTYFDGIGFRKEGVRKRQTRVGEGEVGLAALERRTIEINDLRERGKGFYRAAMAEEEGFTAYYAVPLIAKADVKGVLEIFHREKLTPDAEWMGFLNALALQAAIAIDNTTLFNDLQRSNVEMMIAYDSTLEGWAKALELRDEETEGHTRRVVDKTLEIARAMGMGEADLVHVRRGAVLHDIGKMSIPDSILLKTGTLTDEEMEIMRGHTVNAFELLSPIVYLRPALDIPYCHHEKWDGSGYPRGLKGEQIPLAARIFSVVDTWDALRNERRYHPAWSREKTCEHIRSLAGIQFDPAVVDVFTSMECGEQ